VGHLNHQVLRSTVAAAVACALTTGIVATAAADSEEVGEVLVTAKRLEQTLPQQLAQYGTRVNVISAQEVRNGSYVDVAQTLQALAPGLFILPKNGPFDYADISLLGSRTDDVLWLLDGVRLNNRLYSGTPPNDTLPSSLIDRVEVLEGGQALFYGTAAVAGAINIQTKSFSDTPQGSVTIAGDTNDSWHGDGVFSTAFGAHHIVLYASKDDTSGYQAFRDEDYQPSSTHRKRQYEVLSYGAKYGIDFTEAARLSASWFHTDADLDYALPYRVAKDLNSREEDIATLKFDYSFGPNADLYLKGYYHRWHTTYDTVYNDLGSPGDVIVLYDDAFWGYDDRGINALLRFSFNPGVDYFVGYDLQHYGGRDEVLVIEQNKETTQALFAQVRVSPEMLANTHLAAGVRYNSPDEGEKATIWSLSGQYDFTPGFFARASLGTNFRLPTAEELFANDPQDERGNPDLKPEHSKSLNLSIGGKTSGSEIAFHWELVGYAREITDLIDYATYDEDTQQDVFGNVPGTVKVRGVELAFGAEWTTGYSLEVSYAHNRSHLDGGNQLARIPEALAKASFDYHPAASHFGATVAINYTGDVAANVGSDLVGYGGYTVVDVSGRYFVDEAHRHQFNLSLQNAFDQEYGRPGRGCRDVPTDGPYDCSDPYTFVNLGLPRTLRASYTYAF
jgi:outer membrane cobalamin receptor